MTLSDALKLMPHCLPGSWFRPVTWRKSGHAFEVVFGQIQPVTSSIFVRQFPTNVEELQGEWEIVKSEVVLNENV